MADNNTDPAGSTQMFRAFVDDAASPEPRAASSGRTGLIVMAAVVAVIVVVAVGWLALK